MLQEFPFDRFVRQVYRSCGDVHRVDTTAETKGGKMRLSTLTIWEATDSDDMFIRFSFASNPYLGVFSIEQGYGSMDTHTVIVTIENEGPFGYDITLAFAKSFLGTNR